MLAPTYQEGLCKRPVPLKEGRWRCTWQKGMVVGGVEV